MEAAEVSAWGSRCGRLTWAAPRWTSTASGMTYVRMHLTTDSSDCGAGCRRLSRLVSSMPIEMTRTATCHQGR